MLNAELLLSLLCPIEQGSESMNRTVVLWVRRRKDWAEFTVSVPDEGYVLDALEDARRQDETLLFRHACHHASCGTCGIRINGREGLACVTKVSEVAAPGQPIRLEPLRNLPHLGDLLVDLGGLTTSIDSFGLPSQREVEPRLPDEGQTDRMPFSRFENCIECGLCLSACPIVGSDSSYLGPAALAAAERIVAEPRGRGTRRTLRLVDGREAVWRCHLSFECSAVCPSNVDPAAAIMRLRKHLLWRRPGT